MGDTGNNNRIQKQVAKAIAKYCKKNVCDMGLLLGDNIYPDGVTSVDDPQFADKFEHAYQNLHFTFYPVLGNHDVVGNWEAQIEYASPRWDMQGRYYRLDQGFVTMYALDSNLYINIQDPAHPAQVTWLEQNLSTDKSTWKIVYAHQPIYSSGLHGNTIQLIEYLNPLLQKYAVDFYVCGHDHDLELIENGTTKYVISGAGSSPRAIQGKVNSLFASGAAGFAHLLLTDDAATLKFIDAENTELFSKIYHKIKS